MKQLDIQPALVFEDRMYPGEWRVDWTGEDGEQELAIFSGRNARERAIRYAERQYGVFQELSFER
ncbi:MAG: hypothetical protein JO138_08685 [Acidobacteriaceae bacterium]|nr:hypothetical protein [Acidobacteriaceae bacterium]